MDRDIKELQDLIDRVHSLAVRFYLMMGYSHQEHHKKLYESQHPTEQMVWEMACYAFEEIDGLIACEILEELEELKGGK